MMKSREKFLRSTVFTSGQFGALIVAIPCALFVSLLFAAVDSTTAYLVAYLCLPLALSCLPLRCAPGFLVGSLISNLCDVLLAVTSLSRLASFQWTLWLYGNVLATGALILAAAPAFAHLAWRLSRASGKRRLYA